MSFYYSFDWFRVINNTYVVYYYTANSIRGSEKKITHDDGRPDLVSDVGYKKSMREKWLESVECLQVEQTLTLHCLLWILTIKWRNRSLNFSIRVSFYIYSILVYIWGELFFAVPSMNFRRSSIYLVASLNWLLLSEFPWYTLHSLHERIIGAFMRGLVLFFCQKSWKLMAVFCYFWRENSKMTSRASRECHFIWLWQHIMV